MSEPNLTTYREGQPRSVSDWSPEQLRTAITLADSGNLRLAADLVDSLLTDDRIAGVLSVRVKGLLRLPHFFESDSDPETETPEESALAIDFPRAFPEADLAALAQWATLLGVGVGEQVWEERDGRVIPRLRVWHPRWLRFDWTSRLWKLTLDGGEEVVIHPGDGKWILHMPYGQSRPWAHAPWKALGLAFVAKRYAQSDWNSNSEAHGQPVKVGTAPDGANAETRQQFKTDMLKLVGGSAITMPPGYDLKLVEAVSQSWQQFPALIAWADKASAVCIAGQNLTSDVTGGSFAAAKVHETIAAHLIQSDEQTLSTTLHEQSLVWWSEFNFGDSARAPWVRWDVTPPADRNAEATTLVSVGNAVSALTAAGVPVDVAKLAERYDIPLSEDPVAGMFAGLRALSTGTRSPSRTWRKTVTLASGREGPQSFEDGHSYAEALVAKARDEAAEAVERDAQAIRDLIEAHDTPEALNAALVEHYAGMDASTLAEITYRTLLLADLAGRYALVEEVVDA